MKQINTISALLLCLAAFASSKAFYSSVIHAKLLAIMLISAIGICCMAATKVRNLRKGDFYVYGLAGVLFVFDGITGKSIGNPSVISFGLALVGIFAIVRQLSWKGIAWVFGGIVVIGSVQALLGLLQLYGIQSSNHVIFKITGTFHNPGPYAGFLLMSFVISCALYVGCYRFDVRRWTLYVIS